MIAKVFQANAKRFLAVSLAVWLSGVTLVFCCGMPKAQASGLETESCPFAKTHHCAKQSNAKPISDFTSLEREQQTLDCCRFSPQIFDKARKVEKIQKAELVVASVKLFQPVFSSVNHQFFAQSNFRPVVVNREDTYLKNCVFRI